ncbi:hypothetical protein AB0M36_01705 [Actinoplanes sp. NPDC051346]|uniref:hypothetical protein n=1 Tax=Actinoplanes sp. NPDC051346 TaxID=3155048 RepID=UPI003446619F
MWVDDDQLRTLRQLQQEAEGLAQRLSAAAHAAGAGEFTGTDTVGVVTVTIRADGTPNEVTLRQDWRDRIGDGELSSAVMAAHGQAITARLSAWGAGLEQGTPPEAPSVPQPALFESAEPGDPTSRQSALALRDLLDLLNEVDSRMPALTASLEAVGQPVTAENLSRTVRVTLTAGSLSAVTIDRDWLRSAHHDRLGDALAEALAAAHRAERDRRERIFDAEPAVTRLQRLTGSPETLLREIGLIR